LILRAQARANGHVCASKCSGHAWRYPKHWQAWTPHQRTSFGMLSAHIRCAYRKSPTVLLPRHQGHGLHAGQQRFALVSHEASRGACTDSAEPTGGENPTRSCNSDAASPSHNTPVKTTLIMVATPSVKPPIAAAKSHDSCICDACRQGQEGYWSSGRWNKLPSSLWIAGHDVYSWF